MSKPIAEIVCPDCGHLYDHVFDRMKEDKDERRNAECPCGTGKRVERPIVEAPRGPQLTDGLAPKNAENPNKGPLLPQVAILLRTIEDEHEKQAPETFAGGGNSLVSAGPVPPPITGRIAGGKGYHPILCPETPAPATFAGGGNSSVSSNQDVVIPKGFVAYDVNGRKGLVNIGYFEQYPECARIYGLKEEDFRSPGEAEEAEEEEELEEGENGRLCTPSSWNF